MQDLVSFIQNHAREKHEDMAGEVLALLLREEAGQTVLRDLFPTVFNESSIEVETRRRDSSGCIPDIHLVQEGRTVALLELKFWAPLTQHQVSGRYFDITPHVSFIVPMERLSSLRQELSNLTPQHNVVIRPWDDLLDCLQKAAMSGDDHSRDQRLFVGAVEHLKEFCYVIEQQHFIPFNAEQLRSPAQDESIQHLVWLTREVIAGAVKAQLIEESGRLGAGYDDFFFYGQNVVFEGSRVWIGYWPKAWKRSPKDGPLWIYFGSRDATALSQSGQFKDGIRVEGHDLAFPLLKPDNAIAVSQEDEVQNVLRELYSLSDRQTSMTSITRNGFL